MKVAIVLSVFVALSLNAYCQGQQSYKNIILLAEGSKELNKITIDKRDKNKISFEPKNVVADLVVIEVSKQIAQISFKEYSGDKINEISILIDLENKSVNAKIDGNSKGLAYTIWLECANHTPAHKCKIDYVGCTDSCTYK